MRTSSTFCDYRRLLAPGRGPSELSQQVRALLTLQEGRARAASRGQALTSISPARPPPAPPPPKRAPTTALTLRSKSMTSELEELGKCRLQPTLAQRPACPRAGLAEPQPVHGPPACPLAPLPAPVPGRMSGSLPECGLPRWPPASFLGSGELRHWASSLLVRLTLFCFEFLGLSLVDKGKQTSAV